MDRVTMSIRSAAAGVVLALVSAACGSTVQITGEPGQNDGVTVAIDPADELDLGSSPGPGDQRGTDDIDTPVESDVGAVPSSPEHTPATTRSSPTPSSRTATTAGPTRGLTDDQIFVGFAYSADGGAANEAIGVEGITTGDMLRNNQVLLDHFNARGGAGGREIVPVFHSYDATSTQSFSAQEQAGCATYTEDNEVFVVFEAGTEFTDGTMLACLDNAGVPSLNSPGTAYFSDAVFDRFPNFAQTNTLTLDAIARFWPAAMNESGYFEPRGLALSTRVGLVTYDTTMMRQTTERSLEPAMRAVGQEFVEKAYISVPGRLADVGTMTAQINNAILRFATQQVQHVMIQDYGNALLTFLFMQSAEVQGYRPRYGLTTNNGGQILVSQAPSAQFAGARMVGWNPLFDVPEHEFNEPMGEGRAQCDRIYADAGVSFAGLNERGVAYLQCDGFMSLVAAVDAVSGPLTQDKLIPAFVGLGTSYQSALVGPTKVAPDRRYGVSRYRLAEFFSDCTCFRYTSGWRQLP